MFKNILFLYSVKSLGRFLYGNHFYQWPALVKSACYLKKKKKKTTVMHEMLYLDCRIILANFTNPEYTVLGTNCFLFHVFPFICREVIPTENHGDLGILK